MLREFYVTVLNTLIKRVSFHREEHDILLNGNAGIILLLIANCD